MTTYLDSVALEAYTSGVSARAGVRVTWDEPNSTPRTDGKTIWLPRITSSTTAEEIVSLRYYIKHEVSHIVDSDFDYLNEVRPLGALALLNNLFEDNRIDYRNDKQYAGDVITSNAYWTLYNARIKDKMHDPDVVEQQRSVISAFALDALARTWFSTSHDVLVTFMSIASDDNVKQLDTLLDAGCLDDLVDLRDIADKREAAIATMELAKKVFTLLFPAANVEEHVQECAGMGEGKGTGEGESEAKGCDMEDRIVNVDKLEVAVPHDHTPSRTGIHSTYHKSRGAYVMPTPSEYIVLGFPVSHPKIHSCYLTGGTMRKADVTNNIETHARPMANKLRIKLQTQSKGRYEYGHKRGKLHNGSLHRVLHGDVPSAERVFRQHKVSDVLDTAVTLLVDCSGSMSGKKFELACSTAGAMGEALKPLHIPYNILGFTNHCVGGDPMIWNFTEFNERVPVSELVNRFHIASNMLWENTDGDALAYAYHHLLQRREHRKVLLVMSDGSPSGRDSAGDIVSYTHQVANTIQEQRKVDLYGVGIMDDNVKYYYKNHVVVRKPDELAQCVLSIVQRSIGV